MSFFKKQNKVVKLALLRAVVALVLLPIYIWLHETNKPSYFYFAAGAVALVALHLLRSEMEDVASVEMKQAKILDLKKGCRSNGY